MSDAPDGRDGDDGSDATAPDATGTASNADATAPDATPDEETLRERVEEEYDFENFGPADMAEMTGEEWEAAFDPDAWITGERLLDRVEDDLLTRVAAREVFAHVERIRVPDAEAGPATDDESGDAAASSGADEGERQGGEPVDRLAGDDRGGERVVAYSDAGYAVVYPDGSVEGSGTVLRDVKPVVALCSMPDYEVPEPPADAGLPEPSAVPERSGELGNRIVQVVAAAQVLAGLVLLAAPLVLSLGRTTLLAVVAGLGFLVVGGFLFVLVANARLSDRFRAEQFRNRLRATGVAADERPDFLPVDEEE